MAPVRILQAAALGVIIAATIALAADRSAQAANPASSGLGYVNPCYYQGASWFAYSPNNAFSNTSKAGGTCSSQAHVHAYFWGSDLDWHYAETSGSIASTAIQVAYPYWTANVWGYHEYPTGSNQLVSNAY